MPSVLQRPATQLGSKLWTAAPPTAQRAAGAMATAPPAPDLPGPASASSRTLQLRIWGLRKCTGMSEVQNGVWGEDIGQGRGKGGQAEES